MLSVKSLLNPAPSPASPPSPCSRPGPTFSSPSLSYDDEPLARSESPFLAKEKMAKDSGLLTKGKPKGDVNFLPFENLDDASLREVRRFQVRPFGKIQEFCRHIPYNSGKKNFYEKTGRESFEVFQYTFRVPEDENEYLVLWDYNVGLVRMTPFFKCCKYGKTTPAKMLNLNPGLRDITHSITGGSIMAQGYWMPFLCAKAVCATFCAHIAGALIPIFGPDFPRQCVPPHAPEYGHMVIDPAVIAEAVSEADRFRLLYSASRRQHQQHHHLQHQDAYHRIQASPASNIRPSHSPMVPVQYQQQQQQQHRGLGRMALLDPQCAGGTAMQQRKSSSTPATTVISHESYGTSDAEMDSPVIGVQGGFGSRYGWPACNTGGGGGDGWLGGCPGQGAPLEPAYYNHNNSQNYMREDPFSPNPLLSAIPRSAGPPHGGSGSSFPSYHRTPSPSYYPSHHQQRQQHQQQLYYQRQQQPQEDEDEGQDQLHLPRLREPWPMSAASTAKRPAPMPDAGREHRRHGSSNHGREGAYHHSEGGQKTVSAPHRVSGRGSNDNNYPSRQSTDGNPFPPRPLATAASASTSQQQREPGSINRGRPSLTVDKNAALLLMNLSMRDRSGSQEPDPGPNPAPRLEPEPQRQLQRERDSVGGHASTSAGLSPGHSTSSPPLPSSSPSSSSPSSSPGGGQSGGGRSKGRSRGRHSKDGAERGGGGSRGNGGDEKNGERGEGEHRRKRRRATSM